MPDGTPARLLERLGPLATFEGTPGRFCPPFRLGGPDRIGAPARLLTPERF